MLNVTKFLPVALQFQGLLSGTVRYSSNKSLITADMNTDVDRILSFWFEGPDLMQKWFFPPPGFDAEVQEKFGNLMLQARTTQLAPWVDKPTSSLALIILLDQLPRNVWRNSLNAFHSDAKALDVASRSIVKGFDREVTPWQQLFFYLPFMHGESVVSQVAGISLLEGAVQRVNDSESAEAKCLSMGLDSAKKHAVPISKFGRFPGRNVALGRDTTEEEAAFLKEFPGGF